MSTGRRKARKEALFTLYRRDLLAGDLGSSAGTGPGGVTLDPYQARLLEGVMLHREEIDAELSQKLEGWTLDRLAPLERNLLRIGLFEVRWVDETPAAVAVAEAVALAKRYCSDEAARLVNGVLGALIP